MAIKFMARLTILSLVVAIITHCVMMPGPTTSTVVSEATTFEKNPAFLAINDGTGMFRVSNDGLMQTNVPWKNSEIAAKKIFIDDASKIQVSIANCQPGDTLVLKDGVYRDIKVHINKPGITFRPQTASGVTITGDSDIYIEQDYITVSGFKFYQIKTGDMPIVHFVNAKYSRFTNNAFYDCGIKPKNRIVQLRTDSQYNHVDRNLMDGNLSIGISVAGTRSISRSRENVEQLSNWYNRIERNYIKNVSYPGGDVNGKEGIQLGNLADDVNDLGIVGRNLVEYNLMENVDYDPEVISVKTNENIIRFNTLRGSNNGGLVVRAGDGNLVSSNFIFNTKTGIRVNGVNNKIFNNYIEGSKTGIRIRPRNPSTNITIANNIIVNTKDDGISVSAEPAVPWNANIYNNIWQSNSGMLLDNSVSQPQVNWANNLVWSELAAQVGTLPPTGVIQINPKLVKSGEIYRLDASSPAVNAGVGVDGVNFDIDRQLRDKQVDIGADELSKAFIDNKPLIPNDVAPFWAIGNKGKRLSANKGQSLLGSNDNDFLYADNAGGNNRLNGGNGNDEIILGTKDFGFGGDGNDFLEAKYGSGNILNGESGNDQITVGSNNLAFGGDGDDLFDAKFSAGGSVLDGGKGNDEFFLGSGDNVVGGEGGDRFLNFFGGDNIITGGAGADEFWLANGKLPDSPNTITDFEPGIDVLGCSGLGLTFSNLSISQNGLNTIVSVGNKRLVTLARINSSSLGQANFTFM